MYWFNELINNLIELRLKNSIGVSVGTVLMSDIKNTYNAPSLWSLRNKEIA